MIDLNGKDSVGIIMMILKAIHHLLPRIGCLTEIEMDPHRLIKHDVSSKCFSKAKDFIYIHNASLILSDKKWSFIINEDEKRYSILICHPYGKSSIYICCDYIDYKTPNTKFKKRIGIQNISLEEDLDDWYESSGNDAFQRFYFDCDFSHKDTVLALGAKWNSQMNKWSIVDTISNRRRFSSLISTS